MNVVKVRRALVSLSDKSLLEELIKSLARYKVEILSTGGTLAAIKKLGYQARAVEGYTGFPEMLDGRVKTLHPKIHGGLLALRHNQEHVATAQKHHIEMIDLAVVNLYPFEQVIEKENVALDEVIENIDIGGPSMIRSAAKNSSAVTVLTSPSQYSKFIEELDQHDGATTLALRQEFAQQAFAKTALYDATIAAYLSKAQNSLPNSLEGDISLGLNFVQPMRYGENPHQQAAFYVHSVNKKLPWRNLQGKELSYNNLLDLDAALRLGMEYRESMCAIFKHTNPCGIAAGQSPLQNLIRAIACDPISYFGGIALFNDKVDLATAQKINESFFEIIVAKSYSDEALQEFSRKKNLRVVVVEDFSALKNILFEVKSASGGILLQQPDFTVLTADSLQIVTKKKPSAEDLQEMLFAFQCVKYVKSNAIVFSRARQTLGIGAGQMSRLDAMQLAIEKAKTANLSLVDSYLGSDAFFPFKDAVELAVEAKVKAIVQPGGSMRDQESIDCADAAGIIMAFTGVRHFRH